MTTYELIHSAGQASFEREIDRCEVSADSVAGALREVTDWPFSLLPDGEGCAVNPETSASYEDAWYARPVEG